MKRWWSFLNIFILALTVLGISRLEAAPRPIKQVSLDYNGWAWTTATQAADVAELLVEQVGDYSSLIVTPDPNSSLEEGMSVVIKDSTKQALNPTVAGNIKAAQTPPPAPPKPAVIKPTAPIQSGLATWYRFGDKLTAASRKYPKGTKLRVIAVTSGKSVDIVVNDYGPSPLTGIDLDLNVPAFEKIAPLGAGKIKVKYYKL